ncbi:MAG TPA: GAP family protein [Candidatus Stackebrandtia faecavium]|nr:GAP family protein [Candidatus Stackebrandtia faecavium]
MEASLIATLVVLALVDSTSTGTFVLPIWFMITPGRLRAGRVLVFLATVTGFYFLLGLALLAGASAILPNLDELRQTDTGSMIQLVLGAGMLVGAFFIPGRKKWDEKQAQARAQGLDAPPQGRLMRWRDKAVAEGAYPGTSDGTTITRKQSSGLLPLMGLALVATSLESMMMLPYLAGIGFIQASGAATALQVGVLAGYCLVMVVPALVLLLLRMAAGKKIESVLQKLSRWLERNAGESTGWIVGILGFLIARDALTRVGDVLPIFLFR